MIFLGNFKIPETSMPTIFGVFVVTAVSNWHVFSSVKQGKFINSPCQLSMCQQYGEAQIISLF